MKPKIELNKEYPLFGGGWGVVTSTNGSADFPLIGYGRSEYDKYDRPCSWREDGSNLIPEYSLMLPSTATITIEVPPDATHIIAKQSREKWWSVEAHFFPMYGGTRIPEDAIPIDEWIETLEPVEQGVPVEELVKLLERAPNSGEWWKRQIALLVDMEEAKG